MEALDLLQPGANGFPRVGRSRGPHSPGTIQGKADRGLGIGGMGIRAIGVITIPKTRVKVLLKAPVKIPLQASLKIGMRAIVFP